MDRQAFEKERLAALKSYGIMDTEPETDFDRLTMLAAYLCNTPIAAITLVDGERQWFKSSVGLPLQQTERHISFCSHTVNSKGLFLIEDASVDIRFGNNPLVTGEPGIRFYAGIPLISSGGFALGALAVMDSRPRQMNESQLEALHTLAQQVMLTLEYRLQRQHILKHSSEHAQLVLAQLKHSQDLLQIASRMTNLGGWEVDLSTNRVTWSDEVGKTSQETAETSMTVEESYQIYTLESRLNAKQAFEACCRNGTPFDLELEVIKSPGQNVWVRVMGEAVHDDKGSIVRVHGAFQDISEQKWAETAIQQSQLRFRQLADAMPQIVWTAEPNGTVDYANQAMYDYTGLTHDDLHTHRWLSAMHEEDLERSHAVWSESRSTGKVFSIEYRVRYAADGSYRWHQVKAVPIRDEHGDIVKWYGTATDIHDHKVAVEEVRRLARRLAATMESITDAFFTLDREWRFTYVNSEAERLLQRRRDELLGRSLWNEFAEACNTIIDREYHRAIRENCTVEFEVYYQSLNGWFEVHAYPSEEGLAVYFRNITERKLADERLKESEERFKNVVKAATDAIWDWDLQSDSILWNGGMHSIFGFPAGEAESACTSWTGRIHLDDRERVTSSIYSTIQGKGENWEDEYRFLRKDGSYAYVLDRGFVIRDKEGRPVRMVGGMTDLTLRKHSEIELARLNRALKMRSACSDSLIRARDEKDLLTEICKLAVNGGYTMAWVGFVENDEACSIVPVAYAGRNDDIAFLSESWLSWSEDALPGQGPAGRAVRSGMPVVCEDVLEDASYSPWLASAHTHGYRGVICLPLRDKGNCFGLMILYLTEVREVAGEEISLLQELADDVAFGIVNLRAQKDRQRLQLAVEKVVAGVSASSGEEFFKQLALNMAQAVGADAAFISKFSEGDVSHARTMSAYLDGAVHENFSYDVTGTACGELLENQEWVVSEKLPEIYPECAKLVTADMQAYVGRRLDNSEGRPLGLLYVMFRRELKDTEFVSATLRIFAARAAAELQRQEADRHIRGQASLLDKAQDAIIVRNMDGRITFWNKGAERLYGWTPEEAIGRQAETLLYQDVADMAEAMEKLLSQGEWSGELTQRHKNSNPLTVEARWTLVKDSQGQPQSILTINTDISQRKAAEREIQQLAFYDPLTHLPNRLLLLDRLQQAVVSSKRINSNGALLFIDLDNFKTLNDTLGHDKGDQLLQQVAARLLSCVRTTDTVARLGGDEFVIMLLDLDDAAHEAAGQAKNIGEKILYAFDASFELSGYSHYTTPSIGITLFNGQTHTLDELLKRADLAMYQAKAAGKNALRFFDPEMQAVMTARVELESDIRASLQQQNFLIFFQPQINAYGNIRGAEVLVRWNHPRKGLLSPAEFIGLAEETGLIVPLGTWILESACRQLKHWANYPETAKMSLSVNVSVRQFRHPDFVEQLCKILDHTGADPQRLTLELTESLFVEEMEAAIEKMNLLKKQGIRFSLDDFGTGYSSLFYLKRMPLDQLKIDPSFVQDVLTDPNDAVIVKTIIALAQSLGLEVTAEGVETQEQHTFLAENGCYAYQGYFFSKPLPVSEFEVLIGNCPLNGIQSC